jgi:hypothetical protein
LRSTGTKSDERAASASDLPRKRYPSSRSEKWKFWRICSCVSVVKYISVFREISRSIFEIGGSWITSCRPKMTERRRSCRNE